MDAELCQLPGIGCVEIRVGQDGIQVLHHCLTGESCVLPPGVPWRLAFSGEGHAFVGRSGQVQWAADFLKQEALFGN
eukprot:14641765-Alexandrium_andersonii.AAC.1